MLINQGLVGPKAMTKVEVDGQQVNIPALLYFSREGRGFVDGAHYWICVLCVRKCSRQIRSTV